MIELKNLTKSYKYKGERHFVYKNVSVIFPDGKNIGIIGPNGAGKSTLIRLLAGAESPDKGEIITDKRLSFPVGFQGGFQGSLTGREITKFLCRIYNINGKIQEIIEFVKEFSELGEYYDWPVKTYSTGMRARLAFALSMAFDFDYYLLDEITAVGDINFKNKCIKMLKEKMKKANIILASHSLPQVKEFCDIIAIPYKGDLLLFDDFNEASKFYNKVCNEGPAFRTFK